ncbi:MAG: hypothetical protein H6732_14890 [Alphaproteobacteria bacterium]|nr:hypothetical protein [Alphaproteobacteria bacterium]
MSRAVAWLVVAVAWLVLLLIALVLRAWRGGPDDDGSREGLPGEGEGGELVPLPLQELPLRRAA